MDNLPMTMVEENEALRQELAAARQRITELEHKERRYRKIFENAVEGIFQITLDGRFLLANPRMAQMLGYATPDALIQTITSVRDQIYVHDEDFSRLLSLLEQADVVENFEGQFSRADGRIIWLSFNLHVVRDGAGSLLYYEGTAQDVTRRKEIEERLQRRESQLTEVQEMVHLGSWEWDIRRNVVTWSDELYRIYGLDKDNFGATFEGYLARVHPDDRDRVQGVIAQTVQLVEPFAFEERIVRPDGTERVLESVGKVVVNEQGQPVRLVGSCLDVTERKLAEQQIKETAARAESLVQTAARLSANIELEAVLRTICEQTRQALEVSAVSISLYDEGRQQMVHGLDCGLPAIYTERVKPLSVSPSFLASILKQSEPYLIEPDARYALNDPNSDLYKELDIQTIVSVGLVHEMRLVGGLNLHVLHKQREFAQSELTLFKGLADQAALAIVNAQLHEAGKEQAAKLLTLYENSQDIISILDMDLLLSQIVQRTAQLVKADRVLLLLVDAEAQELQKVVSYGYEEGDLAGFDYQEVAHGISGWVLTHGQPVMSDDMIGDPRNTGRALKRAREEKRHGRSIVVAPLLAHDAVIGTLTTIVEEGGKTFTQADMELVLLLANQAAIAIENARLYEASWQYTAVLEQRVFERTAELEQQNHELIKARERAEAADRLKSVFLAIMSHELRTPLNSIIGFTGLILQELAGPLNEEQAKQLGMVRESAQHLLSLINDVLDISKIEAGQMQLAVESVNVPALIEKVAASIEPTAVKKGLGVIVAIEPTIGEISGDARRIEQVLLNLVSNAVKFTLQGMVRIECQIQGRFLLTEVSDSGIGIKPEDMDKLFQPFTQIESGLSRSHEGTGLGLSICKRLVEMLGGEIWVESEPGAGSTFGFTLPINGRSQIEGS